MAALQARFDHKVALLQANNERQDDLLHSILARLDDISASPALAVVTGPAPPSTSSVAASSAASGPPMIVGGPQPAGYTLAGQNQGMPLWVQASLLTASVMHAHNLESVASGSRANTSAP